MDINARIANFENMAKADPDNEMAHFSLGSAYAQAGRHNEAAASYLRCTDLAPGMSKAYQLAGDSLIKAGQKDRAAEVLLRGYAIATERGDLMPRNSIADLLKTLGRPVPDVKLPSESPAMASPGEGGFVCRRTGRPGTKMTRPPFRGPVGAWIAENITQETWNAWIAQGTKVINELRLDLSREQDEATYDQHMREYLGIDEDLHRQLTGKGRE